MSQVYFISLYINGFPAAYKITLNFPSVFIKGTLVIAFGHITFLLPQLEC